MKLTIIPPKFIDYAWRDGASSLGESCVDECTPDQLKMLLAKDERALVRMDGDQGIVGWGAFRVDNLPNMRVLHITNLTAHDSNFEAFFDELKLMAEQIGCIEVRCSCLPAQSRLFKAKCGFEPVYETLRVKL